MFWQTTNNGIISHLHHCFQTAISTITVSFEPNNNRIISQTVRNRFTKHGILARFPYIGPILTTSTCDMGTDVQEFTAEVMNDIR
jgi:hypothetical protein